MPRLPASLQRLLSRRVVRSLMSGGVSFLLQTTLFEVLAIWLKLVAPSTATLIGGEAAILLNFTLNNYFSFGDIISRHSLLTRLLRFQIVVSGALLIQFLCVYIAEHATSDIVILHLAYGGSIVIGFFWNYTWYKFWVWRLHPVINK